MDIKKRETITVQLVKTDTYGNLEFTSTQGTPYKISKARINNFSAIQEGAEVELIWVTNPHKPNTDYIYSATQTGVHKIPDSPLVKAAIKEGAVLDYENIPIQKTLQPTPEAVKSNSSPVKPQNNTRAPSGAEIRMTMKEVSTLYLAGQLETLFPKNYQKIIEWYKSKILSTIGI
jgi:hypothetical protein